MVASKRRVWKTNHLIIFPVNWNKNIKMNLPLVSSQLELYLRIPDSLFFGVLLHSFCRDYYFPPNSVSIASNPLFNATPYSISPVHNTMIQCPIAKGKWKRYFSLMWQIWKSNLLIMSYLHITSKKQMKFITDYIFRVYRV